MYKIYFYRDKNGKEPVKDYIAGLAAKKDKDSLAAIERQNPICRMERQRFYFTTRFYEADTKNSTEGNRTGKAEFN